MKRFLRWIERTLDVLFMAPPYVWPEVELHDSHGGDPDEWPAELRVREFPASGVRA